MGKTTMVRCWGERVQAYADVDTGRVWAWDSVAGHYTTVHSLSEGQVRYVRARTLTRAQWARIQERGAAGDIA